MGSEEIVILSQQACVINCPAGLEDRTIAREDWISFVLMMAASTENHFAAT